MKSKKTGRIVAVAVTMQFGILASSAQTGEYLFTGSETTVNLNPGTYDITAYGAQGGAGFGNYYGVSGGGRLGGLGAEIEGQFDFSEVETLTILVGGAGSYNFSGLSSYGSAGTGGGGGGSFVVNGSTPLVIAGGGGGATAWYTIGVGYIGPGSGSGILGSGGGNGGNGGNGGGGNGGGGGGGFYSGGGDGSFGYGSPSGGPGGGGGSSFYGGGGGGSPGNGGYGGGGGGGFFGGGGGGGYDGGYGGNGGYGVASGGGGDSYVDSSAINVLAEVSGVASPDDSTGNGEIIITEVSEVPEPTTLALAGLSGLFLRLFRRQRK
jgi:hypothetical protein